MKKVTLMLALGVAVSVGAQKLEDQKAIKSMCGCYEVKFNFAETFKYSKDLENYVPSMDKHETALEWVQAIEDQPQKISLQHLLLVGNNTVIKHWRQDWLFQNTKLYDYNGFNDWKVVNLKPSDVKGQWTQKVYEVSDEPRYEASASWANVDGRTFWNSTANAPLPRREYTKRDDYNITLRNNTQEITKNGWIHDQDNKKIIRSAEGKDVVLAEEKGYNTYTKVADEKCKVAQEWWAKNQDFWKKVCAKWQVEFDKNQNIKLKNMVNDQPLFVHLSKLKTNASQEEINTIIDLFIIR